MKKYSSLVSLALCLTVVVCSFNKESIEDFKARKYGNLPFGYEIKLIQKFDSFDDWSIDSPPIDIRAYVENGNLDSVHKEKSQESGYIRLGIKEYLAESNLDYKYSESRYLIDDGGNFIRSLSKDLALEMGKKYNPNIDYDDLFQERSVHDDDLAAKQGGYWYILTSSAFANGTYGKFILQHIGIGSEGYKSLSEKNPTNSEVRIESLDDVDLSEYSPYDWSNSEMESENVFRVYVKLNFGGKMVGLDEWIDNGCELTDSWIYDTNSEKGWVYWGQPLKHVMNTTSTLKSKTDDLIESAELIKSSAGRIIYGIDISLDALSYDYLDNWDDAPKVLIDSFKNNKEDSNHLDFTKITKSYRVAKEKNDRLSSINRYVKDSYINFKSTLDKVAEMLITLNAENQEEIDALEKKLNDSLSSLKLNIQINTTEYGSRILDFAGLNWNVIDSKYGINYFIVSDPLSRKELIEVGVAEELLVDDEIFFSENKNYGDGYSDSLLSIVNTRFYDQNIANTYFEDFVVPVSLGNEKIISNNTIQENLTRTDSPTKIDYKNGKKQAFTLSMSDWNSSSARVLAGNLYGNIKLWTTTPGELDKSSRVKNIVSMLFE